MYFSSLQTFYYIEWAKSPGWCVDANGREDGRNPNQPNYTEEDCFAQCDNDPNLNGCTFAHGHICITYTGNIVKGSNGGGHECYYRSKNDILNMWHLAK